MVRWIPAVVFAALTFAHALALPTFEGMDEPAHLSSILQFASGHGRPIPGAAKLHRSIEDAIPLVPGPYHQWEAAQRRGGLSYAEWRRLDRSEQDRRVRELAALDITSWRDGAIENWQAQHPPLYYALVGSIVRASGATTLMSAHRVARLTSAALFATTGLLLTAFISGPWRASPRTALFVCLLPMWYVIGARISNDALAIPALGLALLMTIDQMRRPAEQWRWSAWLVIGVAAAIGLAAKGYGLIFAAVGLAAIADAGLEVRRKRAPLHVVFLPIAALAIMFAADGWWLIENESRGAGLTGTNENVTLMTRGVVTMRDRLPYLKTLIVEQPMQALSAGLRAGTQMLYASNWTIGAAPWWFYVLQLAVLAAIVGPLIGRRWSSLSPPLSAGTLVAAAALVMLALGIARSVLDYFILFGETRLAQGFYVWAAGPAFSAVLALALDLAPPRRQYWTLAAQVICLVIALSTDVMFWSGRYERDPVWRTPVRVASILPPTFFLRPPAIIHPYGTSTDLEGLSQSKPRQHPGEGVPGD